MAAEAKVARVLLLFAAWSGSQLQGDDLADLLAHRIAVLEHAEGIFD